MLNWTNALLTKQIRENSLHHPAVGQHVRDPAGHPQIVFQYHKLATWHSDQVRSDDSHVNIARYLQSSHLPPEVFTAVDNLTRHGAIGKNAAFVINVPKKQI